MKKYLMITLTFVLCLALVVPVATPASAADISTVSDHAYQWLKHQQDATAGYALDGLVDSFEDYWSENNPKQIAYTYDQAVAAIAFLLEGDITRADKLLNKMKDMQDPGGFWINSYWWNNGAGEEIRKHVGPVMWMAIAAMDYEKITGNTKYRAMAEKAIDWCLQYQTPANGAITGGETTWDSGNGSWTHEVWSSTEHNIDAYSTLLYFASVDPSKAAAYNLAATKVKSFLDNYVWDDTHQRFQGGWKNNTNTIDPYIPLDVNPWGVLGLGATGTHNYQNSLAYVENANGNPGTLSQPAYVHTLSYNDAGDVMTAYDFDWQSDNATHYGTTGQPDGVLGPDIWLEGSAFMSAAYYLTGNTTKADSILDEIGKKSGTSGDSFGGLPYSLKGTSNNYWTMAQQNCVSSTGWFIIAANRYNPFKGEYMTSGGGGGTGGDHQAPSAPGSLVATGHTQTSVSLSWSASTDNVGIAGYDVYSGSAIVASTTGATSATVANLSPGTAYTLTVKARDAAQNTSNASNSVTVTTDASGSGGGGGGQHQEATADFTIDVTESGSAALFQFTPTAASTFVDLHYTVSGGGQTNVGTTNHNGTWEYSIPNLQPGDQISYRYTYTKGMPAYDTPAYNYTFGSGGGGGAGDNQAPSAPESLVATGHTQTSVSLSWNASTDNVGVAGYDVYSGSAIVASTTGATSATAANLSPGTAYTFTVKARDAAQNTSNASNSVTVTTDASGSGSGGGDGATVTTTDYTIQIDASGTDAEFRFTPATASGYVILHYQVNQLTPQNVQTANHSGVWEYTVPGLSGGDTVSYQYTYVKNGIQQDSPWYSFTR